MLRYLRIKLKRSNYGKLEKFKKRIFERNLLGFESWSKNVFMVLNEFTVSSAWNYNSVRSGFKSEIIQNNSKWFWTEMFHFCREKILIPKLMENRKPLNVKPALLLYNLWHFAINIVFFYYFSSLGWFASYSWRWLMITTHLSSTFHLASVFCFIPLYRCEAVNRSPVGNPMTVSFEFSCFIFISMCSVLTQIATVVWWFLMFKFVDLIETMILACGKRHELITRYHVVHHFLMPK